MPDKEIQQENNLSFTGNPGVCYNCSQSMPTCCRCGLDSEDLVSPLSESEWQHMRELAPWTGHGQIVVKEHNTRQFVEEICKLFPGHEDEVRSTFPEGGTHLRMGQNQIGQCTALGPQGCLLPREARPFFCNLYPFWFIGRRLQVFENPQCLALQTLDSAPSLCAAFDTDPHSLFQSYLRLCLAWGILSPSQDQ